MSEFDTEAKLEWCELGLEYEHRFISEICPKIGLHAVINIEKYINKYAPDLFVMGKIADLKHQSTPFFTAGGKWGIDPQYAVSFNCKDYVRYSEKYPYIDLYFWIERDVKDSWIKEWGWKNSSMWGVWYSSFENLKNIIDADPIRHSYERRVDDVRGNAKDSYIIDVRKLKCIIEESK